MPMPLPPKPRAKVLWRRKREAITTADWLGFWALSLGFCAIILACIANFAGDDKIGAAYILIGSPRSLQ